MAGRFGASKYRNSLIHYPTREEYYRKDLPQLTIFSGNHFDNEIKSNRQWIVTLTSSGELTYREYKNDLNEEEEEMVGHARVGNGSITSWDLSKLEDGTMAIGNSDGSISIYTLPESSSSSLIARHTIPAQSASPITHLHLHPTTPNILLVSSSSRPLTIYDTSSSVPKARISLNLNEPKGIWSIGWSTDGTKLAILSKSGNLIIFEPRKSNEPIITKSLVSLIQPLKPCKLIWINENIFITSFSKFRNRQYSLFSSIGKLDLIFNQILDTNSNNLLIPLIDKERNLIYLIGKGDLILRQIEISNFFQNGFQESIHNLNLPLLNSSIIINNNGINLLNVMKTEISKIFLFTKDKDGNCLIPISIRIPRKQLIDFHSDLFPDIIGTVPEQSAEQWFDGKDNLPLYISLDPSKRNIWEDRIKAYKEKTTQAQSAPDPVKPKSTSNPLNGTDQSSPTSLPAPTVTVANSESPSTEPTTSPPTQIKETFSNNTDLPALLKDEDYSSTSYKSRIVADYLAEEFERHKSDAANGPLFVGLQGPQGCGKTTFCSGFVQYLKQKKGLTAAVLSLDDLYKTHQGLKDIAAKHPDNALLSGRGPPGTHDVDLALSVIEQVKHINNTPGRPVNLPIFNKSLCDGEGDRSDSTVKINGPIDVFILEGWSMGFAPLSESALKAAYDNPTPASTQTTDIYYTRHTLSSLQTLNTYLSEFAQAIYPTFKAFIQVEPLSYDYVFKWRLQQEHAMKSSNGGKGMTDEQVQRFVERYMPGYELWKEGINNSGTGWEGRGLKLIFGSEREILDIFRPATIPIDKANEVKEEEKGDIQLKQVQKIAEEKTITLKDKEVPVQVEQVGKTEITPFPPLTQPEAKPVSTESAASPKPSLQASQPITATSNLRQKASANTQAPPNERYNPNWSRKFLAGKSPLIPTYDALPPIQTLHQDSRILKSNSRLAFFPIQGTGGRLNVHPLSKKGRLSVGGEGYLSAGVEIVDFDVELAGDRVAVAGEDGLIRVWTVDSKGIEGVGPEADQILKGKGIDKITQIAFHPTAKDLLVGLTNDHGSSFLRFWDLSKREEVKTAEVSPHGAFNFSISPEGSRVAIATKDNQILVLDPRSSDNVKSGKAHDSPRSFQIAWIDANHVVSVGFSRGSQRKMNLYRIGANIEIIYSMTIDVSPSVLFPVYDPDTSILYVWGKGERVIQTYEIQLSNTEPITKLPSHTASSPQIGLIFQPKRIVDVKKVEIAKCLRLTSKTLEEVTITIPRNKPEFFQDDIYVSTTDVETYVCSASEWLEGKDEPLKKIDLRPEGMISLSQAPKMNSSRTKKFVPAANVMSEEEKKRQEMDALFAKAKMDESSDEEEIAQKGLPPPDDDW
ncbi:uncharacterized protein I206_103553 [Kwoniella pini CBS 10737]|uniref:Actin cross-linking n=1 Tax=Kwoniella pini CBS 10737 TaxID=1296096 RepID=A0A1B9I984_9TREE|nr:uncharacterized protein I206_01443 [Kwoniella pini CBS 10737]OCF52158.1 hypothetical protein I206_01443 [Kwoniella pini CBS 10737]